MLKALAHVLVGLGLPAAAVGVRPLVVELPLQPGETGRFALTLMPAGQPERVRLRLYQPVQMRTGDLVYQEADPVRFAPAAWVRLDAAEVEVPATQELRVEGQVAVPFGTQGSHTVIVMVEPQVQAGPGSVGIQVRYAVRLHIRVSGLERPARVEVQEFALEQADGRAQVRAAIHNPSLVDLPVRAEVTIRDDARRLVARVPLMTQAGRRSGQAQTRVYPGSTVDFTAPLTQALVAGRYELQLFVQYGERHQTTLRQELVLQEPLVPSGRPAAGDVLVVEPTELVVAASPGGLAIRTLQLANVGGEPLQVYAFARQGLDEGSRSIWPYLQLRGQLPARLGPGERARLQLTFQSERGQADGGYYGTLVLRAWPAGADPALLPPVAEQRVALGLVVGDPGPPQASVAGVNYRPPATAEDEARLVVHLANPGAIHLVPGGRIRLEQASGQAVGQWPLRLAQDGPWVVPGQQADLVAGVPPLSPGAYRAVVRIEVGGRVLVEQTYPLRVDE